MNAVEVSNLTKTYSGGAAAVKSISFAIREGRCVSLLGPNGAGKTTTLHMLSGLLKPTEGSIRFAGANQTKGQRRGRERDIRELIGYLPQHASFFPWMTGTEYIRFAGRLSRLTRADAASRGDELLRRVGLFEARNRRIGGYSGGMKQRLGLAQALIHRPRLLLLDEPVSSLDPVGRREVLNLLKSVKEETTVLFSTHVLHDAEDICDDVLMIRDGQLVLSGELNDIREQHRQPLLYIREDVPGALRPWADRWAALDGVREAAYADGTVKLIAASPQRTRTSVLRDIAEHDVPVRSFEMGQTTLEHLFMKVVAGE